MNERVSEIKDEFDCVRYTKATQVRDDGMVEGDAFALRGGEAYLSMNCLDLFEGERETQLDSLRSVLREKLTVRRSSRLSILNVGQTKRRAMPHAVLEFIHQPEPGDDTHCGLFGLEYNDELVQDLIAESVSEVVSAYE